MIHNKVIGYILFTIGLLFILAAVFQSYQIFTNRISPPIIFQASARELPTSNSNDLQKQMNDAIAKQLIAILPVDMFAKSLNILCWSIFASILILAGAQISSLGIKMFL